MARFLRVDPHVVAYDLHPDYLSTRYALRRPAALRVAVQHHHAHVASAMGEHGLDGQVLGLAYDGTGLGTDGTAWGGELLVAGYDGFERLATFRPIALAGADRAIRHVWRIALAAVLDAFGGDAPIDKLPIFGHVALQERRLVEQMLARRINTPLAHGAGRLFDAVGALVLSHTVSAYEGQIALQWNLAADPAERREYPYAIDTCVSPWQFDWRPMVRRLVDDMCARQPAGRIAAKFHNTLARASAEMVHAAAASYGRLPVVLTGGVFQNARLAESVHGLLHDTFRVHLHRDVPPGDGGIALGQAMVANAVLRASGARQGS
jgi:hydrogenase maturation protein HypF